MANYAFNCELRDACHAYGVLIDPEAEIGFRARRAILLESHVDLRKGIYDIDFIGAYTYLGGRETLMRHIASIGRFCSIASNIVSGQEEHPTDFLSAAPMFTGSPMPGAQPHDDAVFRATNGDMLHKAACRLEASMANRIDRIVIGSDVWIGEGAFIRRGVTIGDGAVIASRSVVVRDVPPYAIVGGTPARLIRYRFEPGVIADLMALGWWKYGVSAVEGADFSNIGSAISTIAANIHSGRAQIHNAPMVSINEKCEMRFVRFDPETSQLRELVVG